MANNPYPSRHTQTNLKAVGRQRHRSPLRVELLRLSVHGIYLCDCVELYRTIFLLSPQLYFPAQLVGERSRLYSQRPSEQAVVTGKGAFPSPPPVCHADNFVA